MSENRGAGKSVGGPERNALGIYVHVPFCASTCDFCAFYQTSPTAEGIRGFLDSVENETKLVSWTRPVDTVFWGGGTPGLLSPGAITALGDTVRKRCGDSPPAEWSVEMAPASVTVERLRALKDAGVTRISMGVQSFEPRLLDALGRQHTREQIFRAYERVRSVGFASVNLDLMFALPGQEMGAWTRDIEEALALQPDHLSTYCLTFEEDTKLWVRLSRGQVKRDVERERALYLETWQRLGAAGFAQYEVSNFARPGHECRHNVNTWRMREWIGLGPSAASQHDGWRGANPADLDRWRAQVADGRRATDDRTELTPALLAEDALIFGLRMNEGVDLAAWRKRFPGHYDERLAALFARMEEGGLAVATDGCLRLTDEGRLLADAVGAEIMAAMEAQEMTAAVGGIL